MRSKMTAIAITIGLTVICSVVCLLANPTATWAVSASDPRWMAALIDRSGHTTPAAPALDRSRDRPETLEPARDANAVNQGLSSAPLPSLGIDANTISSEKVTQFVRACLQVVALIEKREGELQASETDSESLRIQREIEADAIAMIEQAGLTRQEYLQLLSLANVDPEFGERVATLLQEASDS